MVRSGQRAVLRGAWLRAAALGAAALAAWSTARPRASGNQAYFPGIGLDNAAPEDVKTWRAVNTAEASTTGIAYRRSKNLKDIMTGRGAGVPWESVIQAVDEGDGWLRVDTESGTVFVPMEQNGVRVIEEQDPERVDWKDAAYARQMQRVEEMRKRMDPNRRKSPEEMIEMQRRKAVWKAMSTRNSEGVLQADIDAESDKTNDGMLIRLPLEKPLGINFLEINMNDPCGAMVGDLADGMNAKKANRLQIGDILIGVNGRSVRNMPLEEALQPILDAEGAVDLVFYRAD